MWMASTPVSRLVANRVVPSCTPQTAILGHVHASRCPCNGQVPASTPSVQCKAQPAGGPSRRDVLQLIPSIVILGAVSGPALRPVPSLAAGGPTVPSPEVEKALERAVSKVVTKSKAAVALRLVFHDAGTYSAATRDGGLNASIQYELDRPENFGLKRGWRLVEQVRDSLSGTPAEGVATDADLVALVGAQGVRVCGGPKIPIVLGRAVASGPRGDPEDRMPGENFSAEQLKANFAAKGLSTQEMVVLLGSHTLGSKGFGDPQTFDNEYFKQLLIKPWANPKDEMASMIGLPSDHVLPDDPECLPFIQQYAADQRLFFNDFAAAYAKMTALGVQWL